MGVNYQLVLDKTLASLSGTPSLLMHSCCGPCSSYVLEYLAKYFKITVYYYNPNIYPAEEYQKRLSEQTRLLSLLAAPNPIVLLPSEYRQEDFYEAAAGIEAEPEGGARCEKCFRLRLEDSARKAKEGGFDYFTTTLSVSPHKNSALLNEIGGELAEKYAIPYLYSDFKKREGYKRSIELSKAYNLYRQEYCGCKFSLSRGQTL